MVTFLLFLPVLNHPLPLELFVYLRLIIGILSLRTFAHLTVLSLYNPALNLTFSLLPITSSHPHASASDSTFDYWRYINIWMTLIDIAADQRKPSQGYRVENDMGTGIHPHPQPTSQILSQSPRHPSTVCPHSRTSYFHVRFIQWLQKLHPCFGQTTAGILLNSHRQCCYCHSFTVHWLSPWTNSRSSTASALNGLTVTAVLPHVMLPFPRYYRTHATHDHGNTAYLFKNSPTTVVITAVTAKKPR